MENPSCKAGEEKILNLEQKYLYQLMSFGCFLYAGLGVEKLEWGNSDQINQILHKYSGGFDLILGADIYILCPRLLFMLLTQLSEEIYTQIVET